MWRLVSTRVRCTNTPYWYRVVNPPRCSLHTVKSHHQPYEYFWPIQPRIPGRLRHLHVARVPFSITTLRTLAAFSSTSLASPAITEIEEDDNSNTPPPTAKERAAGPLKNDLEVEMDRLRRIRNVGIFAHVDAGKTTVTERMLALAGVVHRAGSVDDGNTVTDFLPAERERGITIQSAAVSFPWIRPSAASSQRDQPDEEVTISLIDTPGHVDFSVEVHRSVAVLDGAVLVVDAVAGAQAQTETVWRAMTRPQPSTTASSLAQALDHPDGPHSKDPGDQFAHEPLPCLALINKMDKEGCRFAYALESLARKLPGANPIAIQLPLFRCTTNSRNNMNHHRLPPGITTDASPHDRELGQSSSLGSFVGAVDLIHMQAILWPDHPPHQSDSVANVEKCIPDVITLLCGSTAGSLAPVDPSCSVTKAALRARHDLFIRLAECGDEAMEECFLNERDPSPAELRAAVRRATLSHRALPVMAGAALRGKGVEPVLDAIADFLPSPLDRLPPAVTILDESAGRREGDRRREASASPNGLSSSQGMALGHPLHSSLLALAFKVVHMKGRGGSGDGRVVFARVYSGQLTDRDTVLALSPPSPGETPEKGRTERIGGMLELSGGRFGHLEGGVCPSGGVCALVGLKSVVTGDTIIAAPEKTSNKSKKKKQDLVCLAGVASPRPVLKVRLEAESTEQHARLSEALRILRVEDPSLHVEETDSCTLLSGLGELHIEIALDRLDREFGLQVLVGTPSVAYRETVTQTIATGGLIEYDRTIGGTRLQASINLELRPSHHHGDSSCKTLAEPEVYVSEQALQFFGLDDEDATLDELMLRSEPLRALVQGCQGALKRGSLGPYPLANVECHVLDVDAHGGLASLHAMPGSIRAAAAHVISTILSGNKLACSVLEPTMGVQVTVPNDHVGPVLSDLTSRRGIIGEVILGENGVVESKATVHGDVPLVEILGYANRLRGMTAGEGAFSAEYKGHSYV